MCAWIPRLEARRTMFSRRNVPCGHTLAIGARRTWWNSALLARTLSNTKRAGGVNGPAEMQLCAQALCLEEMLGQAVTKGAIYYHGLRRRREAVFDAALRRMTLETIAAVRNMIRSQHLPEPLNDRRCKRCSLVKSVCRRSWANRCVCAGCKGRSTRPTVWAKSRSKPRRAGSRPPNIGPMP